MNKRSLKHLIGEYVTVWNDDEYAHAKVLELHADTNEVRVLLPEGYDRVVPIDSVHAGDPAEIDGLSDTVIDDCDEELVRDLLLGEDDELEQEEFLTEVDREFLDDSDLEAA